MFNWLLSNSRFFLISFSSSSASTVIEEAAVEIINICLEYIWNKFSTTVSSPVQRRRLWKGKMDGSYIECVCSQNEVVT